VKQFTPPQHQTDDLAVLVDAFTLNRSEPTVGCAGGRRLIRVAPVPHPIGQKRSVLHPMICVMRATPICAASIPFGGRIDRTAKAFCRIQASSRVLGIESSNDTSDFNAHGRCVNGLAAE